MFRVILITMLSFFSLNGCGGGDSSTTTPVSPTTVGLKTVQLAVSGFGAIQSSTGQTCRADCVIETQSPTLQLEPKADSGSQFAGWMNDCSGTSACTLNLNSVSKVTATAVFQPLSVTLKIVVQGSGIVQVSGQPLPCRAQCDYEIPVGTTLTITATPINGANFQGWSRPCPGQAAGAVCNLTVNQTQSLSALFTQAVVQHAVQLNVVGLGQITSPALSAACTGSCSLNAGAGTVLDVVATPDAGQRFVGWNAPCTELANCTLTILEPVTLTARFAPVASSQLDDSNFVTVTNPHSTSLQNYPLQFARPFAAGEIGQFPQLTLNGQPLPTQADVKQRHPDGSVRHAIISAVIPQIAAGAALKLSFVNQSSGRQQGALDKAAMLAGNYNFDATIEAKFADLPQHTVSARAMLQQDKFSFWTQGDIATTILLVDHSADRVFDFGADQHRSVRPAFYATFWPDLNKVQVRYVGEITNTLALQDQSYDLTLSAGLETPQTYYRQPSVPHLAMTRWTKQFWLGEQVPVISLNHQLEYLARTKLLPNYDLNKKIPETTMASQFANWQRAATDLYGAGLWQKVMPAAGGRQDLGLYPSWTVRWLYTGDWRMAEIAMRQAELSGAWPLHLREGSVDRTFDEENVVPGIGRVLSINLGGRPTLWFRSDRLTWPETKAKDRVLTVANLARNSWVPDVPHHPDLASAQYLLTGDYYFLEQSWFSAAYTTMNNNAGATSSTLGRGPTGSEGALYFGEVRAQGWALRTRVHAASISPDGSPERAYLELLTTKALEIWEGLYDVVNPVPKYPQLRSFARNTIGPKEFPYSNGVPSPLGQWAHSTLKEPSFSDGYYDYSKAGSGVSPWMAHLIVLALGRAEELGYPAGPMKAYAGKMLTGAALTEGFELELLSAYRQPTISQPDGLWFTDWLQVKNAYLPEYREGVMSNNAPGSNIDAEFGYRAIVLGTSAYLTDLPGGTTLYEFYHERWGNLVELDRSPKWALKPR